MRATSLERRLAGGEDPRSDRALELRAAQLVAPRERRALAASIEHAVEEAERPSHAFTSAVPPSRAEVGRARGELLDLANELRSPRPVQAGGIALVRRLLRDGESPLYGASDERALLGAVEEARQRLSYPCTRAG